MAEALRFINLLNKIQQTGNLSSEESCEFISLWKILFGSIISKVPVNAVEALELLNA